MLALISQSIAQIMSDNSTTQSDTPMDTTGNGEIDNKIPDISNLKISERPAIEDSDSQNNSIDKIVKDENDIRSQIGSDTQSDVSSIEASSISLHHTTLPDNIPPTQKQLLELQHQATKFSLSLDKMLIGMQGNLTDITNISLSCTELYSETINDTCTTIDGSIKSMYLIMTKCEALDKQGEAVDRLAKEVHDINIKLQHLERLYNK
ncbi:hypothetical protein LOD99_15327 [Oopsacas minuta]|uniref:BLOC-1-related complex subunit 6 C-terminal helix domain-containing protein n=1 Tax=Oopsacas minuta TaxID=111878 RepID=A0AAV7KBH9_9METZ|nr:hypothetical protein LOD99_15327 [Oopsacas minuta]